MEVIMKVMILTTGVPIADSVLLYRIASGYVAKMRNNLPIMVGVCLNPADNL